MPLPHRHRCESVVTKNFGNESSVFIDTAIKAGETGGVISDAAHAGCVLIATG